MLIIQYFMYYSSVLLFCCFSSFSVRICTTGFFFFVFFCFFCFVFFFIFFFNYTATTEIYTLSLHDALPISLWEPHLRQAVDSEMTAMTEQGVWSFVPMAKAAGRRLVDSLMIISAKFDRSEEHTSELQSRLHLVCRLLLEKKKQKKDKEKKRRTRTNIQTVQHHHKSYSINLHYTQ